jgi:DNA-binding NtrC family response regulator
VVQLARRLAVQIEHEPVLKAGHLPPEIQLAGQARGEPGSTGGPPRGELELLREAIDRSGGNLTRAASSIGVSRMRAYRLLKAAGVDIDSLRDKQSS